MNYIYDAATVSPYRVFTAADTINGAFLAVDLTSNGITTSGAGSVPVGLTATETETVSPGEDVNVLLHGCGLWHVGETISRGDLLTAGEGGKAKVAESGDFIFARAFEDGAVGEAIRVQIIRCGVKS